MSGLRVLISSSLALALVATALASPAPTSSAPPTPPPNLPTGLAPRGPMTPPARPAPPRPVPVATPAGATGAAPAAAANAARAPGASGATGAAAPATPKLKVGETFEWPTAMDQVWPTAGKVRLDQRNGKPLCIFFWGTGSPIARTDLVAFDAFVKKEGLRSKMDVYALGGFTAEKSSGADLKDMAQILGLQEIPIVSDPDFLLSIRLGAEQYPEIDLVGSDNKLLAKAIRGLDHGNLQVQTSPKGDVTPMNAADYIKLVATQKTGPSLPRTFPFYPTDRLIGHRFPDFQLPEFSEDGFGKGKMEKLSRLLSGKRPAIVMFFSATCEHCQVDIPQMVKFVAAHPGVYDIIGVTRIRNDQHRKVSAAYFKQQGITWPIVEDGGNVSDDWLVTSTPTDVYLNPHGTVVSASYYQHQDLEADWLRQAPLLAKAPDGTPLPQETGWAFPLDLKDEAGKPVSLSSMAGKPTIVHFWATWCAPCRGELPALIARLPALQAKANVVLVSVEDDPKVLAKHRADTGLSFKSYIAPHGGLAGKLDFSRSVPRTYVLDAHGRIINVYAGTYEWADDDKFGRIMARLTG